MNTTAILETIKGYRAQIVLLNKYIVLLQEAITKLQNQRSEFIFLWTDASDSHYEIVDFAGTNANLYDQKVETLMSSYATYDVQITDAIETMEEEIGNLTEKIKQYEDLIEDLIKLLE